MVVLAGSGAESSTTRASTASGAGGAAYGSATGGSGCGGWGVITTGMFSAVATGTGLVCTAGWAAGGTALPAGAAGA